MGALVGVVLAVILQPSLERTYGQIRSRVRRTRAGTRPVFADMDMLGFLQLVRWSPARPLDPDLHDVILDESSQEEQQWFSVGEWRQASDTARAAISGSVCSVTGYTVDHGEAGPQSRRFVLSVKSSHYGDSVATQRLLERDDLWAHVSELFNVRGGQELLRVGPLQSFFVALSISTPEGLCLALRRAPGGVATAMGVWSLGACETMAGIPDSPGSRPETLFDLARRAAYEEVGLARADLGHIWFSWFGVARPDGPLAVGHVQTTIDAQTVMERMAHAEANYEADDVKWLGLSSAEFRRLEVATRHDGWLPFTCLVARGLSIFEGSLDSVPRRR